MGLNLEPGAVTEEAPNGVLMEVSDDELDRLDLREIRYDRVEVTDSFAAGDRVFAYTAKPSNFAPEPPEDAVILSSYLATVEAAFAALGDDGLEGFRETTGPPPVEVVEGALIRDRIPAGNPREW
jgi:hypothetical protein